MTLKEKFAESFESNQGFFIYNSEKIADDYAIEFAEWLVIRYNEDIIYDEYTTDELLEIFKKEKGL